MLTVEVTLPLPLCCERARDGMRMKPAIPYLQNSLSPPSKNAGQDAYDLLLAA